MSSSSLLQRSARGALAAARHAANRSPAYRTLLAEHGLPGGRVPASTPLDALPVLHKDNTFGRFTLSELGGDLRPETLADVLTSSGRGGGTFGMRLSSRHAHDNAWFDIDLGLEDAFCVDSLPTLVVNCLPMGVVFPSRATTVANVSVREDMASAVLRRMGPAFAQTIVCTDPLFVNRLLDHAAASGVDWVALNASLVLGEEMLVESQREHIARRTGITLDPPGRRIVASSFGVGELGLNLLFETRETIALGRALRHRPDLAAMLWGGRPALALPSIFCFNPLRCHVEVLDPQADNFGGLCITMLGRDAVLPLPRFATGDSARLIEPAVASELFAACGVAPAWLPMVAVQGRAADRALHGLSAAPSVEDVKQALHADPALSDALTGAFQLQALADGGLRLRLQAKSVHVPELSSALLGMQQRLSTAGFMRLDMQLLTVTAFAASPWVDYERKFKYVTIQSPGAE